MEKKRSLNNIVIGVLLVCVLCLSVAFAGFSQTLNVTGTANITSASTNWNVKFTAVEALDTDGYATGSAGTITGSSESITFSCEVKAPGDACTLNGTISNLGSIKALYSGVTLKVNNAAEADNVFEDNDVTITLTPPATWTANTTTLATNDNGEFSVALEVGADATLASDKTYSITVSFDFDQADA